MCGGTQEGVVTLVAILGLSPRVRGNPDSDACIEIGQRSIPACAGEPSPHTKYESQRPVYPRVCGGTFLIVVTPGLTLGLSPRVRGNRGGVRFRAEHPGSIPACAGEP